MYSKHYHCTECGKPHGKIMVDNVAEAAPETVGKCYQCNLAEIKADAYERKHTYIESKRQELDQAITNHFLNEAGAFKEPQQIIQAETLGIGDVPMIPPLELVAQEPDVIEYNEHGSVVMKWEKHVDAATGQRYYQDQKGNKWHYRKV